MTQERVLIWDRIGANRRNSRLLVLAFAAVLLPVAAYLAMYLMLWVAMVLGVMAVGIGLAEIFSGDGAWLAGFAAVDAVISVLVLLAVAYLLFRFASAIVLRLSGARPVTRAEEPELWRTAENLCIGAGLPQPRLLVVESGAANAFATGLDPARASLVVTRGLLGLLDRRELEAVVAHELARIANYDTRLGTLLAVGVALLRLPLGIVIAIFRFLFRIHWAVGWGLLLYLGLPMLATIPFGISVADDFLEEDTLAGVLFISAMVLPFYVFLGAPLIAYLIRVAVLRQREFLADADAVLLARSAEPLATALTKMDAADRSGLRVGGATAHLYVVDPLTADAPWWDRLFSAHPPVGERVALLAETAGGIPPSVLEVAREAGAASPAAALAPRSAEPTAAGAATTDAWAAPAEVARSPSGFRLTGAGTALYAEPDATSAPLTRLPAGALITVLERDRGFVRVVTADDSFGYILSSTSMTAAETPVAGAVAASWRSADREAEAPVESNIDQPADSRRGKRQMRQFWNSRIAVAVLAILVIFFVVFPLLEALGNNVPCLSFPPC